MSTGNLIVQENALDGASDWQLTRVRLDEEGIRSTLLEGYCSHQSIQIGEELQVMVSTNPASRFELEIFRMGYYGGRGARLMTKLGPLEGKVQPDAPVGKNRLRECCWEASVQFTIPDDWISGVYLGRLTTVPESADEPYWQSYVVFIVLDHRPADIIFQCSDNTWQAYNKWPNNWSLYTDPRGAHAADVSASFNRPYGKYCQIFEAPQSVGSGEFLLWEYSLAFWLEEHGYDVSYVSNSDVLSSERLTRGKIFLSVGHDEYWDLRQYDAVKNAIEQGVSVLWLGGNCVHGVTPLTPSARGQANRTLTRIGVYGGMSEATIREYAHYYHDITFRGPDEGDIIGARTVTPCTGGGDWTCTRPDHWIFNGTGMKAGDKIPGLIGWESHDDPAKIPGLEVVAEGNKWSGGTILGHWAATIFEAPKGNIVFNASTIYWPQALSAPPGHLLPWSHFSRPHGVDERVRKITKNLLDFALKQFPMQLFMRRPSLDHLPALPQLSAEFSLRTMTPDDFPGVAALLGAAFEDVSWTPECAQKEFGGNPNIIETWLITAGEKIIATATTLLEPQAHPGSGCVHWVATDPEYRGHSLGYIASLRVLHDFVKLGCRDAILRTDYFRLPAIKTYLKLGFLAEAQNDEQPAQWEEIMTQLKYQRPDERAKCFREQRNSPSPDPHCAPD